MATKRELVNDYLTALALMESRWTTNLVDPFTDAYESAYLRYQAKVAEQEKANQSKAEFLMICLTLAGGSVLTALTGKAALNTVVKELAVKTMVNTKMTAALSRFVQASPVASFALGKVLETSTKYLSDELKKELGNAGAVKLGSGVSGPRSGLLAFIALKSVVDQAVLFGREAAADILEGKLNVDETRTALNLMRQSRFFLDAPTKSILVGRPHYSEALELIMYLNFVMTRDKLVTVRKLVHYPRNRGIANSLNRRKTDISQAPATAGYPQGRKWSDGTFNYESKVAVDDIGDVIAVRINELHKLLLGRPMMDTGWFSELDVAEIQQANLGLRTLSNRYNPPLTS